MRPSNKELKRMVKAFKPGPWRPDRGRYDLLRDCPAVGAFHLTVVDQFIRTVDPEGELELLPEIKILMEPYDDLDLTLTAKNGKAWKQHAVDMECLLASLANIWTPLYAKRVFGLVDFQDNPVQKGDSNGD